jgi:type I restriction enzyme S subunit
MSQWPMVPLGEVLIQYKDYIDAPEPKTYPKLSVKLYGKGVTLDTPTDGTDLKMKRHQLAKAGQVILSEIWGKKGAIGFVPQLGEGALCTSHFFLFDVVQDRLFPKWLEYVFRANYLERQLDSEAKGTTGYAAVRPAHLLKATIPLPPLPEQRRLVERIDALAAKIGEAAELRKRVVEQVNQLLICMAHRNDLTDKQKAQAGWSLSVLGDVITPRTDPVKVDTSANYPNLGIYSFARGIFEKPPINGMTTSASTLFRVRAKQFIYSRLFAFEGAYGIVPAELDGHYVSNEYPTFDCKSEKLLPEFIEAYFKAPYLWKDIATGSKGLGDRRQRVHPDQVLAHRLWVPPLEWQHRIADTRQKLIASNSGKQDIEMSINAMLPAILDRAFRNVI